MEAISFGKASVDGEYFYGVVTGGGAFGPGLCEKIVAMSSRGDLIVERLPLHDNRSGTKRSGSVDYELTGDGVYRAYGYANSNRSEGPEVFFELQADVHAELSRSQLNERMRAMSPENFAKLEHTRRKARRQAEVLPEIQTEVSELAADGERLEVTMITVDDQLQLDHLTVKRHKSCGHFTEVSTNGLDELIAHLSAPLGTCMYCAAHADKIRASQDALMRLQSAASEKNLPQLSGSVRQIKWALEIRDGFRDKNPDSPSLKRATTAKYWIEHREALKS